MNFGLLLAFRSPKQWSRPFNEIYAEHIEQAVYAEGLGYDTIWTTEHHFAEDGWAPSLLPSLSAIAARTSTVRLGTFIIVLPFHHPVRVAEDAATVDIISNGRLDLGVGQGDLAHDATCFQQGVSIAHMLEGEDFRVEVRSQLSRFGQLSCFTQDSAMMFAPDVTGKGQ